MSKFNDLDTVILYYIRLKPIDFTGLQKFDVMKEAQPFSTDRRPPWRVLDARLQALRKAGRITHIKGQWHYVEQEK